MCIFSVSLMFRQLWLKIQCGKNLHICLETKGSEWKLAGVFATDVSWKYALGNITWIADRLTKNFGIIFYRLAACHAAHGLPMRFLSTCLLSNACIVTKRNNRLSVHQHHTKEEPRFLTPTAVRKQSVLQSGVMWILWVEKLYLSAVKWRISVKDIPFYWNCSLKNANFWHVAASTSLRMLWLWPMTMIKHYTDLRLLYYTSL